MGMVLNNKARQVFAMARLSHAPHEHFARLVAAKMPRYKAYAIAIARNAKPENMRARASQLWACSGRTSNNIQRRVSELQMEARKSAELTAERLLDDMLLDCDLATQAGQHAAAIAGRKLIGSELFAMFKERRESINIDMTITNKTELKAALIQTYGQAVADSIWATWGNETPKRLEDHSASGNVVELYPSQDTPSD